jgi:hypothetical protein
MCRIGALSSTHTHRYGAVYLNASVIIVLRPPHAHQVVASLWEALERQQRSGGTQRTSASGSRRDFTASPPALSASASATVQHVRSSLSPEGEPGEWRAVASSSAPSGSPPAPAPGDADGAAIDNRSRLLHGVLAKRWPPNPSAGIFTRTTCSWFAHFIILIGALAAVPSAALLTDKHRAFVITPASGPVSSPAASYVPTGPALAAAAATQAALAGGYGSYVQRARARAAAAAADAAASPVMTGYVTIYHRGSSSASAAGSPAPVMSDRDPNRTSPNGARRVPVGSPGASSPGPTPAQLASSVRWVVPTKSPISATAPRFEIDLDAPEMRQPVPPDTASASVNSPPQSGAGRAHSHHNHHNHHRSTSASAATRHEMPVAGGTGVGIGSSPPSYDRYQLASTRTPYQEVLRTSPSLLHPPGAVGERRSRPGSAASAAERPHAQGSSDGRHHARTLSSPVTIRAVAADVTHTHVTSGNGELVPHSASPPATQARLTSRSYRGTTLSSEAQSQARPRQPSLRHVPSASALKLQDPGTGLLLVPQDADEARTIHHLAPLAWAAELRADAPPMAATGRGATARGMSPRDKGTGTAWQQYLYEHTQQRGRSPERR